MNKEIKVTINQNVCDFPNTFQLGEEEVKKVAEIMSASMSQNIEASPAQILTAYMALSCTALHIMYAEHGQTKADLKYILRCMVKDMEIFINNL